MMFLILTINIKMGLLAVFLIGEIVIYTGNRGMGKTLSMIIDVLKLYLKGYKVYSNHKIFGIPYTFLSHPAEILYLPKNEKKVTSIDEIYQWFSCYEGDLDISKFNLNLFAVTRKKHNHIFGTSQRLHQMSYKTRELVDIQVKPLLKVEQHILKKDYYRFEEMNNYMTVPVYVETRYIKRPERYFKYYDTDEVLEGFTSDVWKTQKKKKKENGNKLNFMKLDEFNNNQ